MTQLQTAAAAAKLANEANREQQRLLKKKCLAFIFGCSSRQIELMVKAGTLPKPLYLGDNSPRWRQGDIEAWLEKLAVHANQPTPQVGE